jgi:uncharacterized protein (TIGR03435 family)
VRLFASIQLDTLTWRALLRVTLVIVASLTVTEYPGAQTKSLHSWQAAAGGTKSFEVASVRQDKTDSSGFANVDLLPGDTFTPTGGVYRATNIGLPQLISFAFKLPIDQLRTLVEQVPWLSEPRYDIEARAAGDPTKDQYRLMMQSLLAERFKLKVHYESRQLPVFELRLAKPGKLGPNLRLHSAADPICLNPPTIPPSASNVDSDGFPLFCGTASRVKASSPKGLRFSGRDVTIAQLASSPMRVMADVSRPLIDQTGIQGTVDFTIEWALAAGNVANPKAFEPDESLPDFTEALSHQLGLKLVPGKAPVELFLIDHVERPSDN